jgi:hypothetical protein
MAAMTLAELKEMCGYSPLAPNGPLQLRMTAAIQLIDLPDAQLESPLGKQLIALTVNDLANSTPAEVQMSPAYQNLWEKLYIASLQGV